uniref:Uncharacterized protein n=1 Tax=Rhodnius prolixus TaxID=13249 RepID=T1HS91_RHOPR
MSCMKNMTTRSLFRISSTSTGQKGTTLCKWNLQKECEPNGPPFTSFSIVKHPEEGVNIRKVHSKPLSQLMEDKQSQMNVQNNLVSLDPNSSMWQHTFQTERVPPTEQKEDFCNNIQAFYRKRCDEEETSPVGPIDSRVTANKSMGISLYSQISKRNQRQRQNRGNMDAYTMNRQMDNLSLDEDSSTHSYPQDSKKKRSIPVENVQGTVSQPLYQTFVPMSRKGKEEPSNILKLAAERLQQEKLMQSQKQGGSPRQRMGIRSQAASKSKSKRRPDEEEGQDELGKHDMMGYSVYEGVNRKSPVFSSSHWTEESEATGKVSQRHYKHSEECDERKGDKYPLKASSQFVDSDDSDFAGVYSAAAPPEPLFKPSSGIVTNKMRYFTDHTNTGRDLARNIYL